jgi:hypothetical protein
MGKLMKIIKTEFLKMLEYRKMINRCPIEELDLSDFNISNDKKMDIEEWKFTGLDNIDYIKNLLELNGLSIIKIKE